MSGNYHDPVNHPSHYCDHPSGVECIEITEHMSFNLGNAVKYLWRAGNKDPGKKEQDLKKAMWYIDREIDRVWYIDREIGREGTVNDLAIDIETVMEMFPSIVEDIDECDVPPEWLDPDAGKIKPSSYTQVSMVKDPPNDCKKKDTDVPVTCLYDDYIPTSETVGSTTKKYNQMRASDLLPSQARKNVTLAGA